MFYVIIPTYNRAHTLLRAIKSVITQKNTHAVIIDDGSFDTTKKLLEGFFERFPEYHSHCSYYYKENGGVSDACNFGIERVLELSQDHKYDFVTRLGSDDEFFSDAFPKIDAHIQKYSQNDIFFFQMINEGIGNRTHILEDEIQINYKEYIEGKKIFGDDANDVIRVSALEDSYYRFEKDLWGGDNILFLKLIKKSPLVAFHLGTYLVHTDTYSMTRMLMDKLFCTRLYDVQKRILDIFGSDYKELNPSLIGLHSLIQARFAGLLGRKKEALKLLIIGIHYRPTDIIRIGLAVISLFPYSMYLINTIIRFFVLKKNMVSIPQKHIPISHPIISDEEILAVTQVMKTGNIVQGPQVSLLEKNISEICNVKYAVAVNSGTAALHCAMYALGISPQDEVITSPFTFIASANPILMRGAKVVFADVREDDFLIDITEVEKKITPLTKAVVPVSLYGQIYDYKGLSLLAKKYNFSIIEDACQSLGAKQNNISSGACGDIGTFSLYATKNIMCGEGGVLVTNNETIANKARRFRQHGMQTSGSYIYEDIGYNYRLPDMLAAIANVQIKKLGDFTHARRDNARLLSSLLENIPGIIIPKIQAENIHVFHQFTIRITDDYHISREELIAKLTVDNIGTKIYYPTPIHLYPHFMKLGYKVGDFPVAEMLAKQALSLPIHPSITKEDIQYIAQRILFYSHK